MRRGLQTTVTLVAVVVMVLPACHRGDHGRVIVLGVCGLHVPLLERLVADGSLPHFALLYREGSVGAVRAAPTGGPPLSSNIWTSYATGQLPKVHGLNGFFPPDVEPRRLYNTADRRLPALWNIGSDAGRSVGVVNWPITYPAERVRGFVISDRYLPISGRTLAQLLHAPFDRDEERVVSPPELGAVLKAVTLEPVNTLPNSVASAEASDRNVLSLAYAAAAARPVDLLMIFTDSVDQISHLYWFTHEPVEGEAPARDVVVDYMVRLDVLVGELMDHLRPADHLVILSDHGMERSVEPHELSGQHVSAATAVGVVILRGPVIRAGVRLADASALDILPTLLELVRIPRPAGLPGTVLVQAFRPGYV